MMIALDRIEPGNPQKKILTLGLKTNHVFFLDWKNPKFTNINFRTTYVNLSSKYYLYLGGRNL